MIRTPNPATGAGRESDHPPTLENLVTSSSALPGQQNNDAPTRHNGHRLVLHVTCQTHKGAEGFTNLVVTRKNNAVALNPHVDNSCILTLDEAAATVLHTTLGEWLSCFSH